MSLEHLLIHVADPAPQLASISFDRSELRSQLDQSGLVLKNWYAAAAQQLTATKNPLAMESLAAMLDRARRFAAE